MAGDSTLDLRPHMFQEHRKHVEQQMCSLWQNLDKINHKIDRHQSAVETGTEITHHI